MRTHPFTIAVTGLNATDNPAPGVGVLRSLRRDAPHGQRLVGLAYDALDPGLYADDLAAQNFLLSYPSSGTEAFFSRIESIHAQTALDVIIPTLDAELPSFIAIEGRLSSLGISTLLPSREQLDLRSKAKLVELGRRASIEVPETLTVSSLDELARGSLPYPIFVKGAFYGAALATCYEEARAAYQRAVASWGTPVVLQAQVVGEELNVVAVGDGEGGTLGAVAMKKLALTDKGKGWSGITIRDPALLELTERFVSASRWRGPCEVEVIRDRAGHYRLLEINPRFPAWTHLATAAGVNLPRMVVDLARGIRPAPARSYEVGKMFVRISVDQITDIHDFERIVTQGEVTRTRMTNGGAVTARAPSGGPRAAGRERETSNSIGIDETGVSW